MSWNIKNKFDTIDEYFLFVAGFYFIVAWSTAIAFYYSFSGYIPQDAAGYIHGIWNVANGNGFIRTQLEGNILDRRLSLFLYVLVIPYQILPSYLTIKTIYILFFILGLYPFYRLFRKRYGKKGATAAFIAIAFHPMAFPALPQGFRVLPFTMVFLSWVIYFYDQNHPIGYTITSVLAMSTHLIAVFLLVPLSFWFYLVPGTRKLRKLAAAGVGIGWFILFRNFIFTQGSYGNMGRFPFGDSMYEVVVGVFFNPLRTLEIIYGLKPVWLFVIFGALAFVPLLSSHTISILPYISIHMLSLRLYTVIHPLKQYAFPVFPFLLYSIYLKTDFVAYIINIFANRLGEEREQLLNSISDSVQILYFIAIISVITTLMISVLLFGTVSDTDNRYKFDQPVIPSDRDRAAWGLIDKIPDKSPVMATYIYLPALTERADMHKFPPTSKECWINPEAAYILLDTKVDWLPGPDLNRSQMQSVINSNNTKMIDRDEGIVLLKERAPVSSYNTVKIPRDECA